MSLYVYYAPSIRGSPQVPRPWLHRDRAIVLLGPVLGSIVAVRALLVHAVAGDCRATARVHREASGGLLVLLPERTRVLPNVQSCAEPWVRVAPDAG